MIRRLVPVLLAVVVAVGLLAAPPAVQDVRAALPDLTIVTVARYDVQPAERRVRVTVDLTLHNRLRDSSTRRFYFDNAFLAVLPGTSGFKISSSGLRPSVRISREHRDYTLLRLNLGQKLFSGRTSKYRLTFYLRDRGGESTRDVRVGTSLASFPVWAFASDDTPGSQVTVVFPKGYTVQVEAGDLPEPTVDDTGRTIYRTGRLSRPLTFFAYFVADRPGAYEEREVTTPVGDASVDVLVRSWPEDPDWGERIAGLFERALPRLGERIGLDWPRQDGLVVQEAVSRSTGGYAGLFDPTSGHVEVAYYADDFVVLHEAAHAWFNGELLVDRWALEAFASYYALEVAADLGIEATGDEITDELRKGRIQLNAWGPIGREATTTEDYAYAATLAVARLIAERAGDDGLAGVWQAAADREGAYQPPVDSGGATGGSGATGGTPADAEPERVPGPPDWRGLLDLLEDRTGESYDDLWREWIIRPTDEPLLDERATARTRYDEVVAQAAGWALPRAIRDGLRAWQFEAATELLDEASSILDQRETIDQAAAEAGLTTPATLRTAFEGEGAFAAARIEIEAQIATIDHYVDAASSEPVEPDLLTQLGMWDTTPEADLAEAASAFAAGDLATSVTAADAARATWLSAPNVGQGRAIIIAAVVLGTLLLLALAVIGLTRRRRAHRTAVASAMAPASAPDDWSGGGGPTGSPAIDPDPTEIRPMAATDAPAADPGRRDDAP